MRRSSCSGPGTSRGQDANVPRLAIGVHDGDWHAAADFVAAVHPPVAPSPPSPAWIREQGAIYTFGGGGAGSIYLDQPGVEIVDAAVWCTSLTPHAPFDAQPQLAGHRDARRVRPGRQHPAAAARQRERQLDVFWVGDDGAVWMTWETGQSAWRDGIGDHGLPVRVTPPGYAPAGAVLDRRATARRRARRVLGRRRRRRVDDLGDRPERLARRHRGLRPAGAGDTARIRPGRRAQVDRRATARRPARRVLGRRRRRRVDDLGDRPERLARRHRGPRPAGAGDTSKSARPRAPGGGLVSATTSSTCSGCATTAPCG